MYNRSQTITLNVTQGTVYAEGLFTDSDPTDSMMFQSDGEGGTTTVCLIPIVATGNSTVYAENALVTRINETVNCSGGSITSTTTVHAEQRH